MNTLNTYVEVKDKKKGLIKGKERSPSQDKEQTCLSYTQENNRYIDPTMNEVAL